jgi:tetratricopeptide (TPR) repeat protein
VASAGWGSAFAAARAQTTTGDCSPIVRDTAGNVEINIACPIQLTPAQLRRLIEGVRSPDGVAPTLVGEFRDLSKQLGVTESALENFFRILDRENVPADDLDATLRKIARRHLSLIADLRRVAAAEPEVQGLKDEALAAIQAVDYDRAESLLRQAEEADLDGARRAQAEAERRLLSAAETRAQRGEVQLTQLKYPEAARHFAAAADLVPAGHPRVRAAYLNRAGGAWQDAGRYGQARTALEEALEIREHELKADDPELATSLNNLAELYHHQGRHAEAEPLFQRALEITEAALGPDHPIVAIGLNNLARLYHDQGHYAEAEPLYQRALEIDEAALGADHPGVATDLNNLAALYLYQGRHAEAEPLFQRALEIDEVALGPDHPKVARDLNNLAGLYLGQRHYAEAEPLYKRVLKINEAALGPDHPKVAIDLNNLAVLYRAQGHDAEAEPLFQRALEIDEAALGPDHPHTRSVRRNLTDLQTGMADER